MISGPLPIALTPLPPLENRLELELEFVHGFRFQSPFSMPRLIESFATLGECGGFAGVLQDPARSVVTLESSRIIDKAARWAFRTNGCDPGLTAVLHNLVQFSHAHVAALAGARLHGALIALGELPPPPRGHFARLSFDTSIAIDSDELGICATFASVPDPNIRDAAMELMDAWVMIIAARGFSADLTELSHPALVPDSGSEWIGNELWLQLSEVDFDESALDPLLNALEAACAKGWPVRQFDAS